MQRSYPSRASLFAVLADHAAVSDDTVSYLRDGGSRLAFWAEVIANATNELAAANLALEIATAEATLAIANEVPEGKKPPTVALTEARAAVDPQVIAARRNAMEIAADLEFAKRAFTSLEKGGSNVRAVLNHKSAELRALGGGD